MVGSRARACAGGTQRGLWVKVVCGHNWGRSNHVAVPSWTTLGMYLHTACCNRKNFPSVQNTLPLLVAAVAARCVAHVSVRWWMCSPDLSSRGVFTRPRVFATTRVFAMKRVFTRTVVGKCLRAPTCLRQPNLSLGSVFARPWSSRRRGSSPRRGSSRRRWSSRWCGSSPDLASRSVFARPCVFARAVRSGSVFRLPRVFAPRRVFAGNVSSDAHVSSVSSPGMCLLTPTCLRRPWFEASVPDPTCLQNVSSVFGQHVHPLRRPHCTCTSTCTGPQKHRPCLTMFWRSLFKGAWAPQYGLIGPNGPYLALRVLKALNPYAKSCKL